MSVNDHIKVYTSGSDRSETPDPVREFFEVLDQRVHAGAYRIVHVVTAPENGSDTLDRPWHDYKNAVGRIARVIDLIEGGYRFDDERAERNIDYLRKALATIEETGSLMAKVFA